MNELFQTILSELKTASGQTKAIAAVVGLAVLAAIGFTAVVSNKPDFQAAFFNLDATETSAVAKALSEAGIEFQVSAPPAPFLVFVDDDERSRAFAAAYGASALDKPLEGIITEKGMGALVISSEERRQAVQKREWQETEAMLATLDFVTSARVRTSAPKPGPHLGRQADPLSASVTLRLASDGLSPVQADIVAKLVSRGLGVHLENLVIADQNGNSLYDGAKEPSEDLGLDQMLGYKREHDERLKREIDGALERALGPNKAYVVVDSAWNFDQGVTRSTKASKGIDVSVTTVENDVPASQGAPAGGVAGISSNVADGSGFGVENAAVADETGNASNSLSHSKEERKEHQPSTTTDETVRSTPTLERLSVALFVDQTVDETTLAALQKVVSAAANLDDKRGDVLSAERLAFYQPEVDPNAVEAEPVELPSGPSPLMQTLLSRGVEILSALVFLVLLLKSLKSAKADALQPVAGGPAGGVGGARIGKDGAPAEGEIDPELLARVQLERLLQSDPERVGEILTSWARGEEVGSGAA